MGILEEDPGRRSTGKRKTYKEQKRIKMPCLACGVDMKMGSMTDHCQKIHGTDTDIDLYRPLVNQHEHLPQL